MRVPQIMEANPAHASPLDDGFIGTSDIVGIERSARARAEDVEDDRLGAFDCDAATLAVGASMTCTATGTVTVEDVLAGVFAVSVTADAAEIAPVSGGARRSEHRRSGAGHERVAGADGHVPVHGRQYRRCPADEFMAINHLRKDGRPR